LSTKRVRLLVQGRVQGIGFRPAVFKSAVQYKLGGVTYNCPEGLAVEVEGSSLLVDDFVKNFAYVVPSQARVFRIIREDIKPLKQTSFRILETNQQGKFRSIIPPDLATCPDCLRELFDQSDRRYRYPFINCTHCGPRFTIINDLPYDRDKTTMKAFKMCPACKKEYDDPSNRRFHAQPNACPECGPQLFLTDNKGKRIKAKDHVQRAVELLKQGSWLLRE
jgi:hydrogenase maturation protein HypF